MEQCAAVFRKNSVSYNSYMLHVVMFGTFTLPVVKLTVALLFHHLARFFYFTPHRNRRIRVQNYNVHLKGSLLARASKKEEIHDFTLFEQFDALASKEPISSADYSLVR